MSIAVLSLSSTLGSSLLYTGASLLYAGPSTARMIELIRITPMMKYSKYLW